MTNSSSAGDALNAISFRPAPYPDDRILMAQTRHRVLSEAPERQSRRMEEALGQWEVRSFFLAATAVH